MTISIITGPGQHADYLIESLRDFNCLKQVIRTYPGIKIENYDTGTHADDVQVKSFAFLESLIWKLWKLLPRLRKTISAQEFLYPVTDVIVSRNLKKSDVLVAFDFVSLNSLRKAEKRGTLTILEHAMTHIDFWTEILNEENEKWQSPGERCSGLFSSSTVRRLQNECRTAQYISVLSSFARRTFLEAGFPEEKIIKAELGVDIEKFFPKKEKNSTGDKLFRFLFVGRVEFLKGIPYLLKAFAELNLPGAELQLVGRVLPEMQPILDEYADERIKIIGNVPREKLIDYYQNADMLVFPTVNDSFGLVVLEAMACGTPVIATFNSCGTDVIDDGIDGFVIPIRDVRALREKMKLVYENRELCVKMGKSAEEKIKNNFTLEHYKKRLMKEYQRVFETQTESDHLNEQ